MVLVPRRETVSHTLTCARTSSSSQQNEKKKKASLDTTRKRGQSVTVETTTPVRGVRL